MLANKDGDYYIVKFYEDRFPIKIYKPGTDHAINSLLNCYEEIQELLSTIDDDNYELFKLINDTVYYDLQYYHDEEPDRMTARIIENLKSLQKRLEEGNDTIVPAEEIEDLSDYGYKSPYGRNDWWEKTLEDVPTKEVVEEIWIDGDKPLRRKRTIIYEVTPGVRSSTDIKYEELPIDDNLKRLIDNTKRNITQKENENIWG